MNLRRSWWILGALLLTWAGASVQAQGEEPTHVQDVVYGHKLGVALTMDVFKPAKPNGIGVIWMVSGGWVSNHNNIESRVAKIFTSHGQTVFCVVHGSNPKFFLREIVEDIHRSVRYIRTHAAEYGVDPNRLGISGGSAGGHLSLMMGAYGKDGDPSAKDPVDRASSKVQAVACFFPPTDFLNYGKEGQNAMQIPTLKGYWNVFEVNDKTPDDERIRIAKTFSPIYGLDEKSPPTRIIHGDADTLVPLQQSQIVIDKLKSLKVPCDLIVKAKAGHGWLGIEKDGEQLAAWFDTYLGKK